MSGESAATGLRPARVRIGVAPARLIVTGIVVLESAWIAGIGLLVYTVVR